jgi:hypothetical protein
LSSQPSRSGPETTTHRVCLSEVDTPLTTIIKRIGS